MVYLSLYSPHSFPYRSVCSGRRRRRRWPLSGNVLIIIITADKRIINNRPNTRAIGRLEISCEWLPSRCRCNGIVTFVSSEIYHWRDLKEGNQSASQPLIYFLSSIAVVAHRDNQRTSSSNKQTTTTTYGYSPINIRFQWECCISIAVSPVHHHPLPLTRVCECLIKVEKGHGYIPHHTSIPTNTNGKANRN